VTANDGSNSTSTLKLDGVVFYGHIGTVICVVEKDDRNIITLSNDGTMKEWIMTPSSRGSSSHRCINTVLSTAYSMVKTKSNQSLVCGLQEGRIEIRRLDDLTSVVTQFELYTGDLRSLVMSLCELSDGTFVSGSFSSHIKRWTDAGTTLQTFSSGHEEPATTIIELNSDNHIIVSVTATTLKIKMWDILSGACLHVLTTLQPIVGLVKLMEGHFAIGTEKSINVYNEKESASIFSRFRIR